MARFRAFALSFLIALAALVGLAPTLTAQTSLTTTTLSSAVTDSTTVWAVASATGIDAGDYLFVDREAARVLAVNGTNITVQRGFAGTVGRAHGASQTVYVGAPDNFYQSEVAGACTAANELYTPRIVLPTGNIYQCTGSTAGAYWQEIGPSMGTTTAVFSQGGTAADALDTIFFIADRTYVVTKIQAVWGVAESTGSMDIMVEKLTGTTACASGTDLQTAAIAGTGTANTVNSATLSATASALLVAAGDRLCVDLSATPNEVVNMVVTVQLSPR